MAKKEEESVLGQEPNTCDLEVLLPVLSMTIDSFGGLSRSVK